MIDDRFLLRLALLYHLDRRLIARSRLHLHAAERADQSAYRRRATLAYRHLDDQRLHVRDAVIVWQRTLQGGETRS
jgi:hypothetical protein